MLKIIEKKDWNKNRTISSEKLKIRILNSDLLKEISCDSTFILKKLLLGKVNGNQFGGSGYLLLFHLQLCRYYTV